MNDNQPSDQLQPRRSATRTIYDWTMASLGVAIILGTLTWVAGDHLYKLPVYGTSLHQKLFGVNHPVWLTAYTTDPDIIYGYSWERGLTNCPGIYASYPGQRTHGLHSEDGVICLTYQHDLDNPTCTSLHELAHAIQQVQSGYTNHLTQFKQLEWDLVTLPGDRPTASRCHITPPQSDWPSATPARVQSAIHTP